MTEQNAQEVYDPNDQSWSAWRKYIVEGSKYMAREAWQIAVDAKNEGYNIYSDTTANVGGVAYDVYMADKWATTTKENILNDSVKKDQIFSVDSFSRLESNENKSALLKEEHKMTMVPLEKSDLPQL